jgi:ABC-type protease/lipase transport system fused ATPase/permease subunit
MAAYQLIFWFLNFLLIMLYSVSTIAIVLLALAGAWLFKKETRNATRYSRGR